MDFKTFSEEELNTFSKEMIVTLYLQLSNSFRLLAEQNEQIIRQNEKQIAMFQEQIAILTNYRFGRKTEKTADMLDGQYTMDLQTGELLLFDEIETEATNAPEKTDEELLAEAKRREAKKRKKGVRDYDLRNVRHEIVDYKVSEEDLKKLFPEGYVEIGFDTSHRVEYQPADLVVIEERIYKYKSKKRTRFAKAGHPKHLLNHSFVTPSLASKIIYDKFINAVPINRISREFSWLDAVIRPPTICRWMIVGGRITASSHDPSANYMQVDDKSH